MQRIITGLVVAALVACAKGDSNTNDTTTATAGGSVGADSGAMAANGGVRPMANPDAQMSAVLDTLGALGGKPIEQLSAAEARKQPTPADAAAKVAAHEGKPAVDPAVMSTDQSITVAGGRSLPVRVYTPKNGSGPWPVVVYYHGGGWVIANKEVYDGGARALSKLADAVVISVDYRQGPEHKFPAAHDDAWAAYQWATKNAGKFKGDTSRIALAGESAGGNLAVATAIAARDNKAKMPAAVISVYPIAGGDTTTASYQENANAKPLNRPMMSWFFKNYLRSDADRQDPRINLVGASLQNLPPVTIINAQIDPLRSDGELLAQKLRDAGVTVDQKTYDGVTHEFFGMGAVVDKAKDAEQMAADALKKGFGK